MSMEEITALLISIALCAAAAAPGVILRPGEWYRQLDKPAWRPPDRLFGPVWLVLYIMIAVAAWLVWREQGAVLVSLPLGVYAVQLVLNGLWSVIFFGLRRPDWAFFEIVALLAFILATILLFYRVNAAAAWLLVPYACWVGFATALTFSVWRRNRGRA